MDKLDLLIAKKLLKNCRITYRELADMYNISINAIYKRVQNMIKEGVITAFTAKPSSNALKSIEINIFGTSTASNLNDILTELGENEAVFFVGIAGGNFLIIGAYLRDISEPGVEDELIFEYASNHKIPLITHGRGFGIIYKFSQLKPPTILTIQVLSPHPEATNELFSTGKLDMVSSIGADHVIDYTQEDFTKSGQSYD